MHVPATPHPDEEYTLRCTEALLAGTLALMTGHVQATHPPTQQRLARQIATNLCALSREPTLSAGFAQLLVALQRRWLLHGTSACEPGMLQPWCAAPRALQ